MLIDRRGLVVGAGAGLLAAATAPALAESEPAPHARAVDAGLAYFKRRAADQAPLVKALTQALRGGDRGAAEAAYIASRPPYEEIEVLAASFPETDTAIDARPYSIEGGEANPDFQGFHRVEALVFRDGDLRAALPYAEQLERQVEKLALDLQQRGAFSAEASFAGMIALATEIAAKKISSEEETWSDRSLLVFRHNLIGIESQAAPFKPLLSERDGARAAALEAALGAARAAVDAVHGPQIGGERYSRVGTAERKAISDAAYRLREALASAAERLDIKA